MQAHPAPANALPGYYSPEQVRARLFTDLAAVPVFAEAIGKTVRTVQNMIAAGLPIVRVGCTPYVVVSKAAEFVMASQRDRQPRRPGRPRKSARAAEHSAA